MPKILLLDLNLVEKTYFENFEKEGLVEGFEFEKFDSTSLNTNDGELSLLDFLTQKIVQTPELGQQTKVLSVFIHHKLSPQILALFPNLELICTRSTGFDHIPLETCKDRKISVCNVADYGSNTVAEHTFALLLSISKQIGELNSRAKKSDFDYFDLLGFDLFKAKIGIIGVSGKIGKNVAQIASGFGMDIYGYDVFEDPTLTEKYGVKYLELPELLQKCQILSIHTPLFESTRGMLNQNNLAGLKNKIFINTSRGGLISNSDLLWAIEEGVFGFAGLDAIEFENQLFAGTKATNGQNEIDETKSDTANQITIANQIATHPRVVFTPHSAYYTQEALTRIAQTTAETITNFCLNGAGAVKPVN